MNKLNKFAFMFNITIIGSSGSGKTVFISVLAEKFNERFLPKNRKTKDYTAGIYGDLVDEQRWPDSTGAGSVKDLAWELVLPGVGSAEITVLDTPGQDVQDIYSDNLLTRKQTELKSRIDGADILVLFVNLVDIMNGKTYRERESLKSFVRFAVMDVLSRNGTTRVAILFSQHDQLKSLLAQQGMSANNVREVIGKYIPELKHEIEKVSRTRVYLGFVASVADVETRWDSQREVAVVVPAKNFRTSGLVDFIDRLDVFVRAIQKEKREEERLKREEERLKQEEERLKQEVQEKKSQVWTELSSSDLPKTIAILRLEEWLTKDDDSSLKEAVKSLEEEISEDEKSLKDMDFLGCAVKMLFGLGGLWVYFYWIKEIVKTSIVIDYFYVFGVGCMTAGQAVSVIKALWVRFREGGVEKKAQQIELKKRLLGKTNEIQFWSCLQGVSFFRGAMGTEEK